MKSKIIKLNIKDLKPHPKNAKNHDDKFIKEKIEKLGYASIITIDEKNTILAGHGRVKALKDLGYHEIEVLQVLGWSEKEKEEYLLSDNQATLLEGFNDDLLSGFDDEMLKVCNINFTTLKDITEEELKNEYEEPTKNLKCPSCGHIDFKDRFKKN